LRVQLQCRTRGNLVKAATRPSKTGQMDQELPRLGFFCC
jgi:hypothetical protein